MNDPSRNTAAELRRAVVGVVALSVLCTAAIGATPVASRDVAPTEFAAEKSRAEANALTPIGAAYDRELGTYLGKVPGLERETARCQATTPKPHAVRGYFHFSADGSYRVVLKPDGGFADCVASVYEGKPVPLPPTLPYVNDFNFRELE